MAANISSNFTKYETEQLLTIVKAYSEFGHYNAHLFDDIADSITYCNHYLAPIKASTSDVVATLAAYAKHGHVRADFIVSLTRGISEVGLSKLSAETRRDTVIAGIRAFAAFDFYPEQVDALLYYAKANPEAYSADELKDVEKVVSVIEAQTGGQLKTYVESHDESADDWYGHHQTVKSHYELYAFREGLVPASYSPLALRSDLKKK